MTDVSQGRAALVSGVILAAGTSRRLGRPKQLLELGGEPLLRHTVRNAMAAGLDEVVLVLGNRAEEIAASVGELGQRTVVNPSFAAGQSTSLLVGIAAARPEADGVMVMLGDQPLVSAAAMDRVIDAFRQGRQAVVQATYAGAPGNPVLFDRSLLGELASVTGDEGARGVVRRHRDEAAMVEVGDVADVVDVDTEADYEALVERWATSTVFGVACPRPLSS